MAESNIQVLERPGTSGESARAAEPIRELADAATPNRPFLYVLPRQFLLATLGDARLRVLRPIRVSVRTEESDFVAEAEELNEFGFGESQVEAVRDLQRTIVELYLELDADQARLGA
jgi:hypothetical protein